MSISELSWEEDENPVHKKPHRSILLGVKRYLSPREIYETIMDPSRGWPYKRNKEFYVMRDRAMISLDYLGALRISEELGIRRAQMEFEPSKQRWLISGVKLGKVRSLGLHKKGCPKLGERFEGKCELCSAISNPRWRERHDKWREVWMPVPKKGQNPYRLSLTKLVVDFAQLIPDDELLFAIDRTRAWTIFESFTGAWCHYFRACGLRYLYDAWGRDLVAVCKYVKISERTAMRYLGSFEHEAV